MAHLVENMAFANSIPWHAIGTPVSSEISTEDMIIAAGLDSVVEQWPLSCSDGNRRLIVSDSQHNVRISKDGSISSMGTVGAKTHVLQNRDALMSFNDYIEQGHATWECAGSLDNGKRVWALARIVDGDAIIRDNDTVSAFMLLTNPHDGSGSLRIGFTPIRVVCANTERLAIASKASKLIRINHSQHIQSRITDIASTMDLVKRDFAMSAERYQYLASRKSINSADLEKYTRIVFNIAEDTPRMQLTPSQRDRIAVTQELFETGKGNLGESWYDAYNAITEYLSHVSGRTVESRYDSLWYGAAGNTSQLALDTAFQLAG